MQFKPDLRLSLALLQSVEYVTLVSCDRLSYHTLVTSNNHEASLELVSALLYIVLRCML